tara:strand:- start:587 stop:739 length:153 start_codon:yes stop_codon:yes gene_type:complete
MNQEFRQKKENTCGKSCKCIKACGKHPERIEESSESERSSKNGSFGGKGI